MIREHKYLVLKISDIRNSLTGEEQDILRILINKTIIYRQDQGKELHPKFVCVRSTWPMYEETWESIEKYIDGLE